MVETPKLHERATLSETPKEGARAYVPSAHRLAVEEIMSDVPKTIKIARIKEGWVTHPDEARRGMHPSWKDKEANKIEALVKGVGWKNRVIQEEREVLALQKGYTLDELNEFVVRYGQTAAEACLWYVFEGAAICHGSEMAIAGSLRRPAGADLNRFEKLFGRRWRKFQMGIAASIGSPVFDISCFDVYCQKKLGYVEDGKVSLDAFIRKKWGDEVHDWFVEKILNSDAEKPSA